MQSDISGIVALHKEFIGASHVQPVVAVVWAAWCGPCKSLKPKLEALSERYNFPLVRIDGGVEKDIAAELKVRSVPTVIVYRAGAEVLRFAGDKSAEELKVILLKVGAFQQTLI